MNRYLPVSEECLLSQGSGPGLGPFLLAGRFTGLGKPCINVTMG